MFWYILIGFVAAQLASFLTLLISREDTDLTFWVSTFIFSAPFNLIARGIKFIQLAYRSWAYMSVMLHIEGTAQWILVARVKKRHYDRYYHINENDHYITPYTMNNPNRVFALDCITHIDEHLGWTQKYINEHFLKKS